MPVKNQIVKVSLAFFLGLALLGCAHKSESAPTLDGPPELIEPALNRTDCATIRGTVYKSSGERAWFLTNCLSGASAANRANCDVIRGTGYLSDVERAWFAGACGGEQAVGTDSRVCHPSYKGACLATDLGDYDCADRGENGPNFVRGRILVVGKDEFLLDRNGNGVGCD